MVNHNGGDEVVESAKSVMDDLTDTDELILVDNGTEDGSGERTEKAVPRVVRLHHSENLPFAAATNRGIQYGLENGARYIGLINPDVRILPGMTRELLRALESDSTGRTAVSPVMLYDDATNTIWYAGGRILWLLGWFMHRGQGRKAQRAYHYAGRTGYLTGCCWLAPATLWNRVGLLDDRYGMYAEDADWSIRARRNGCRLHVVPSALLVHRLSQSSGGGRTLFKLHYRTLASRLFFRMHTPPWARFFQKVGSWVVEQLYALFLLLRHDVLAARAYRRACATPLGERVPWPPSRPTNVN